MMTAADNSRQSFLGESLEFILNDAKIGIVGLCGGGSHIAQQTAHIGFNNFVIADFDHAERSNLTRMVGLEDNDIAPKNKKTFVIERMIKRIKPSANIEIIDGQWQSNVMPFRECSVIFGCVDSIRVRAELESFCRRFKIAYIDIGMDVHAISTGNNSISGQVALSLPGYPCMRCMGLITDENLAREAMRYGNVGIAPQVIWPNGTLASTAVGQAMALLLPWSSNMQPAILMEYDGNRMVVQPSNKLSVIGRAACVHYEHSGIGDPLFGNK